MKSTVKLSLAILILLTLVTWAWIPYGKTLRSKQQDVGVARTGKYLYVAVPGIRNYLEYGGHGILVYDIDAGHKLIKRIPTQGLKKDGTPSNVKGVAVSVATNCIYISTLEAL